MLSLFYLIFGQQYGQLAFEQNMPITKEWQGQLYRYLDYIDIGLNQFGLYIRIKGHSEKTDLRK